MSSSLTAEGVAVLLVSVQRGLQTAAFAALCPELAIHIVQSPLQRLLAVRMRGLQTGLVNSCGQAAGGSNSQNLVRWEKNASKYFLHYKSEQNGSR